MSPSATSVENGSPGKFLALLRFRDLTVISYSFTGSAGVAIVSKTTAYLVTDSRYWLQARTQLDSNWNLVEGGSVGGPTDWTDFLVTRAKDSRIGIDARMLAHEKAVLLNSQLQSKGSKLFYPPQNLIDLIWKEKPPRSKEPVYVQLLKYTGMEAGKKLAKLKEWIKEQPPTVPSYTKTPPTPGQMQAGTLISNLSCIGKSYAPQARHCSLTLSPSLAAQPPRG